MSWINPGLRDFEQRARINQYSFVYVQAAQNRFMRFLPFTAAAFPEVTAKKGVIESELREADEAAQAEFQEAANAAFGNSLQEAANAALGNSAQEAVNAALGSSAQKCGLCFFRKDDAAMPVRGGVDVRGGFHAVFKAAEFLAQDAGLLKPTDNYACLVSEEFRKFFGQHTIAAKETGPQLTEVLRRAAESLGFGFRVSEAGNAGGAYDGAEETCIDGQNSEDLFFGYSTAAVRLKVQLFKAGAIVDEKHPMFVYIPASEPMALAGLAFGLKEVFGEAVHIFALGDIESERTPRDAAERGAGSIADAAGEISGPAGPAGRPSGLVPEMLSVLLSGILETPQEIFSCSNYLDAHGLRETVAGAVHIEWTF